MLYEEIEHVRVVGKARLVHRVNPFVLPYENARRLFLSFVAYRIFLHRYIWDRGLRDIPPSLPWLVVPSCLGWHGVLEARRAFWKDLQITFSLQITFLHRHFVTVVAPSTLWLEPGLLRVAPPSIWHFAVWERAHELWSTQKGKVQTSDRTSSSSLSASIWWHLAPRSCYSRRQWKIQVFAFPCTPFRGKGGRNEQLEVFVFLNKKNLFFILGLVFVARLLNGSLGKEKARRKHVGFVLSSCSLWWEGIALISLLVWLSLITE